MGTNLIYLLYGVPGVGVYALTVASICTTRARLNATIFYDLPSDGSYGMFSVQSDLLTADFRI